MNRKVLLTSIVSIAFAITAAIADSTITSKGYVDTQIDTTQVKIPATGTGNGGIGDTVMTYTNTPGAIGERGIYTGESIYTARRDEDKLITASALKGAFDSIPTTDTTTLVCANPGTCDLWTIVDQTAYGIDLSALVNAEADHVSGYKRLVDGKTSGSLLSSSANHGDWAIRLKYNNEKIQLNGISACSEVDEGLIDYGILMNQSGVQADYESNMAAAPTRNPVGGICYCKLTNPEPLVSRWVLVNDSHSSSTSCANSCARECSDSIYDDSDLRKALFGLQ